VRVRSGEVVVMATDASCAMLSMGSRAVGP
jgi:hypothetical protein